jgi:hypothetical protein
MVRASVDLASDGIEDDEACAAPPSLPFEARVGDGTGPTPPGPPFTRGGKDALGQEASSLPSDVRPIGLVEPTMSN